ncbi:MAG: hypothetical protein AVDCRST_MAG68-924 [uncultured Gemmatimonadetes bacterium]|uniref:Uncharacterized protein n=1 Tax=uncultured Gemmatimonadota bacterium TaxID=203437 RepID=A0A6J4KGR9_9BACT|nr:MAG: hypothetical protein AVDCRST_MAG68-924 [uncultured Gemmatimonadota bacterium]
MADPRGGEQEAPRTNLGKNERILSVIGGGALAVMALRRKGVPGVVMGAAGAALLERGLTGHCRVYGALGVDRSGGTARAAKPDEGGFRGSARTAINRPARELYDFWRDFTNAPRFRDSITAVEILDESTSRWTAAGTMGRTFQWTSRLVEDRPGEYIAWESVAPSDVPNRGSVRFVPFGDGTQAEVHYSVEIEPPGGVVGQAILGLLLPQPQAMLEDDLRHFRELMESGAAHKRELQ